MVLRLISCSPRRSGLFVTVVSRVFSQDLTPASRRQNHTTSPSASARFVHRVPPASTASRPTLMTCATPLSWDGTARISELIWVRREQKYFCKGGWTGKLANTTDLPVGQRLIRFNKLPFCFSGFLVRMP